MEFSKENLNKLLEQSKGLQLLPEAKRIGVVQTVLDSEESEQRRVFNVLLKAHDQVSQAEEKYNQIVSEALDYYMLNMQEIQKDALKNLRKKKEKEIRNKEEEKMDGLLHELEDL
ncbi:MAG: hypothetical protein O3B47_03960 [bacterium]|nr:hypothetical protein [bacterium]